MWDLRNNLSNITAYGNLMCGLLVSGGATLVCRPCLVVVKAYMDLLPAGAPVIKQGIAQREVPALAACRAPPLVDPTMLRWDLVTCRV